MFFKEKRYDIKVHEEDLPKKTARSVHLGKVAESNIDVYMDVDQLCKHSIIAGITGGGKTVAGNVIVEDALLCGAAVVIIDPTTQWSGIIKENTDESLRPLFDKFKMRFSDAKGIPAEIFTLKNGDDFVRITDLSKTLVPGVATVALVQELSPSELDRLIDEIVVSVRAARLPPSKKLRLLIVFDEVHNILPKFGGTGTGFVALERASREFRELGVGLLLLSQVLEDFLGSIRANINTEVQMRTTFDEDLAKARLKYGDRAADAIMRAQTGTGLFHNADYNLGAPFFVSFRPPLHNPNRLTDKELNEYFILCARIARIVTVPAENAPLLTRAKESLLHGNFHLAKSLLDEIEGKL